MLMNSTGKHSPSDAEEYRTIAGRDIVCVSVMDWDYPFWTSRQYLMQQFARQNRVLFVDPPAMFASDFIGARRDPRLARKLVSWTRRGGLRRDDGLLIWSPPPFLPFNRVTKRALFDRLLSVNQMVFRASLKRTVDRLRFHQPILWVSFNIYCGDAVVGHLDEGLSVYHCTDEISGFPGCSSYMPEIEQRLAARCDVVLTSSEVLRASKARYNAKSHFVPNAADVELFERAALVSDPEPEELRGVPRPRAGFIGQIEYRFDGELLQRVAEQMRDWSFILIGPTQAGHPGIEALRTLPNVHFLGLKDRGTLPGYLAGLDVTLIPYKINELTRGIYPLKLYEYLAAGKPVVATPLPALEGMQDRVYLAGEAPTFAAMIERAAREDSAQRRRSRQRLARGETWESRAAQISEILWNALRTKQLQPMEPAPRRMPVHRAKDGNSGGRVQ